MTASKSNRKHIPLSPEAQFIARLQDQPDPRRSFVIPNYAADPSEDDPVNLWMRYDGRLRGRVWNGASFTYYDYPMRTDISSPPAVPAYPARPGQPAAPTTYRSLYTAIWTQGYLGSGAQRTDAIGSVDLPFGDGADGNGNQKSLIGFDYATIAADLAGSTIKIVSLTMTNLWAYWDSGVDIYFGIHNNTSKPSVFPSLAARLVTAVHFGKPQTLSAPLPISFATSVRDGSGKGIALEAPSGAADFYGYAAGLGSGYDPPVLSVTYAK
jgi:hypothetical protein